MRQTNYGFLPNTFIQWARFVIAVIGIILCLMYLSCKLDFNTFIGIITFFGFIGYLLESLNTNIEERKAKNK